jgi:CubicO group peptidase (beta-lactamase class C family)
MASRATQERWKASSRWFLDMNFSAVERALEEAAQKGVFPGAVLRVSRGGEVLLEHAAGRRSIEPERGPMATDVVFDLSSLTKPLATTLAVLLLVKAKRLGIDDRVTRFFHNFGVHGKTHVTFRHLLTHSSGLAAYRPFYKEVAALQRRGRPNFVGSRDAKEWIFEQIHREKLEAAPGTRAVYSDLGFMLLGQLVETVSGQPLDRFCQARIFGPLGLRAMSFIDLSQIGTKRVEPIADMIAPTQRCPWRKRVLCGEVDDENAYAMGGVAGHAGLFGSARDIDLLADHLKGIADGAPGLLPKELVDQMWTLDTTVPGSTRTLGWDSPSPERSSSGKHMSRHTVGHLGFTGTSIWLDLERNVNVILLTNRVHPSRDNDKLAEFRPRIHDLVMEAAA